MWGDQIADQIADYDGYDGISYVFCVSMRYLAVGAPWTAAAGMCMTAGALRWLAAWPWGYM